MYYFNNIVRIMFEKNDKKSIKSVVFFNSIDKSDILVLYLSQKCQLVAYLPVLATFEIHDGHLGQSNRKLQQWH